MRLSDGHRGLLQRVRLAPNDVRSDVRLLNVFSLSCVETADALGRSGTSKDVHGFQRSGLKLFILSCWRQNVGKTAGHIADGAHFTIFLSVYIGWHEGISASFCFKVHVCYISVIKISVLVITVRSCWVSNSCFSSLNIIDFHNISCLEFDLLLFNCSCAWNVIYVLLVSYEFCGFRLKIGNALQVVAWV